MNSLNKILCFAFACISVASGAKEACTPRNVESTDMSFTNWAVCSVEGSIYGSVFIREGASGAAEYRVKLAGLPAGGGLHGFHVHQYGNLFAETEADMCQNAAGHYNPTNVDHAGPSDSPRHVGDLGNVCADADGMVDEVFVDTVALLTGANSILAKGIVVHEGKDDFTTQPTGGAGGRAGCCVIGDAAAWQVADVELGFHKTSAAWVQMPLMSIILCGVMSKLF